MKPETLWLWKYWYEMVPRLGRGKGRLDLTARQDMRSASADAELVRLIKWRTEDPRWAA